MQLRNKLPKIRIRAQVGTPEFDAEVDAAIAAQIALYGNEGDYIRAQKQRSEERPALLTTPAHPGSVRWYWNGYKQSTTGLAISVLAIRVWRTRSGFSARG